jgi:hypothetical protein
MLNQRLTLYSKLMPRLFNTVPEGVEILAYIVFETFALNLKKYRR